MPLVCPSITQKLIEIITRVCMRQQVLPPALSLYYCEISHYDTRTHTIYFGEYSLHSEYFPSQVYHELAHHIRSLVYEPNGGHDIHFYGVLFQMLKDDEYLESYSWASEYVKGVTYAKKLGILPKDYQVTDG